MADQDTLPARFDRAKLTGQRDKRDFAIPIPPGNEEVVKLVRTEDSWEVDMVVWGGGTVVCKRRERCPDAHPDPVAASPHAVALQRR